MSSLPLRNLPLLALVAACLVFGATSGAVAGGLITSAQIKDDNVRSVDIKDGTVGLVDLSETVKAGLSAGGTLRGFSRYNQVSSELIAPGATGSFPVYCPDGQVAIGGSVDWASDPADLTAGFLTPNAYVGEGRNTVGGYDSLRVTVTCASIS